MFGFPIRPPCNLLTEIVQACQFAGQLEMMIRTWTQAHVATPIHFAPPGSDFPFEEWSQTYSGRASRNATGRICPLRDVDEGHLCHGHFPGKHQPDGLQLFVLTSRVLYNYLRNYCCKIFVLYAQHGNELSGFFFLFSSPL